MGTRFQWSKVDIQVVRRFLTECDPVTFTKGKVARMDDNDVRVAAARAFGEPPRPGYTNELVEVALSVWLSLASSKTVEALTTFVQKGLSGPPRTQVVRTKIERIDFLRARNRTKLLKVNVRKHFLSAHKVADGRPRKPNRPKDSRTLPTPVQLIGSGEPAPRPLHRHQLEAVAGLDSLVQDHQGLAGGVLVLPTGAGKTEAMATWLLDRMSDDPALRVLWVAGQQELLRQAAARFDALAASKPLGFERLGREIHVGGYPTSQLANPDMDVAFVTIQSLANDLEKGKKSSLHQFLDRTNIVVIDEAHHAAAPSYSKLFEQLSADTTVAVVGLTATPFPTSLAARLRFRERFPNEIHRVSAEELMLEKILARPVLHVVETNLEMTLDAAELQRAEANDLPPSVLKRLDSDDRNRSIVDTYLGKRDTWGKTLMFATTIDHADRLHQLLEEANVPVGVMHSRMELERTEVLDQFRYATGPAVLISVGMLTEGVDLPDARTAFLGRPTASRILLQQMIGRVLRGPGAGGEAEANVVYFSDVWRNFSDILEPPEALGGVRFEDPGTEPTRARTRALVIGSLPELDPGAVGNIARQFDNLPDAPMTTCRLSGYYQLLDQRQIPVFDHQLTAMKNLMADAMDGSLRGRALLSYFEDGPLPHPSARATRDLVDFVREFGELPEFTSLDQVVGPSIAADLVMQAGPLDDAARAALIRSVYDDTLAGVVYRSFERFEEEVDRELRDRRSRRFNPENERRRPEPHHLQRLPRFDRDLAPQTSRAIEQCRILLPAELRDRLEPPPVSWSKRVTATNLAYWAIKPTGKKRGDQSIRVNRLLRCDPQAVSDEMLCYLIYHELLHHLLPGQSHDAEFRELEHRWPDAALLDAQFDTLHERWDTDPECYKDDHA